MEAKVNKDICIGCGLCTSICPQVFVLDDDGKAKALPNKNDSQAKDAAASCPVAAIEIKEWNITLFVFLWFFCMFLQNIHKSWQLYNFVI